MQSVPMDEVFARSWLRSHYPVYRRTRIGKLADRIDFNSLPSYGVNTERTQPSSFIRHSS
jgi:hypothetical protein